MPEVLESAEGVLDQVTTAVALLVVTHLPLAVGSTGDDGHGTRLSLSASENNKAWGEQLLGFVTNVASGPLAARFTSDGHGNMHTPGTPNFGFFLPTSTAGDFESDVIWVGYDDQITGPDDDYDDFILRLAVTPVPEPATWAMMISGFGLVGAAARRRASAKVTFA